MIRFEEVDKTYNGETGCACGCGGDYIDADANPSLTRRRITLINNNLNRAYFFGNGVELANDSYTRVTRLYFKDGIRYNN